MDRILKGRLKVPLLNKYYTIIQSIQHKDREGRPVVFIQSGNVRTDRSAYFWYVSFDKIQDAGIGQYMQQIEGVHFRELLPEELEISKIIQLWLMNGCFMELKDFLNESLELKSDIIEEEEYY